MFFFEDYTKGRHYPEGYLYGPYSSYEKCFDAIWEELEGDNPESIRITRRCIDSGDNGGSEGSVVLNACGEVMSCCCRVCEDGWEEKDDAFDFDSMWFDIPTPFHAGDIVCSLQYPEEPFVLLDLQTWGSQRVEKELPPSAYRDRHVEKADGLLKWHRYTGDVSDMCAYGCQIEFPPEYPIYIGEPACFLLDLEYFHGSFKPEAKILLAIRAYAKGNLGIDSLIALSSLYELQAQVKKKIKRIKQEDGWFMEQHPELLDIEMNPSARENNEE